MRLKKEIDKKAIFMNEKRTRKKMLQLRPKTIGDYIILFVFLNHIYPCSCRLY